MNEVVMFAESLLVIFSKYLRVMFARTCLTHTLLISIQRKILTAWPAFFLPQLLLLASLCAGVAANFEPQTG